MAADRARLLVRRGDRLLDAGTPHRDADAVGLDPRALPSATVLVESSLDDGALLARAGDGWRVSAALFWSLLDPLEPRPEPDDDDPSLPLRRLWRRLLWWRDLAVAERVACAGLLDRAARGAGDVVAVLERVAAAGSPFGVGAALEPPPTPPRAVSPIPADPAALAAYLLSADGLGGRYGEGFVPRAEQADLAAAVARALQDRRALLAEAGTGTGKTLAYLAPLVARLKAGTDRAVISTYSRALQTQILDGDLPRLLAGDEEPVARLLMGRSNYLCLRQRRAYLTRPLENAGDALRTAALRAWLLATTDGLRDELTRHPLLEPDLGDLFAGVQPCTPDCWEQPGCFVVRARRLARQARLVVVNHALLLSDSDAEGALIGPFTDLVVDEAHRLPGALLDARTVSLDHRRRQHLEELLGKVSPAGKLPETVALLAVKLREHPDGLRAGEAAEELGRAAGRCLRIFGTWWRQAGRILAPGAGSVPGQRLRIAEKDVTFAPLADRTAELLEATARASAAAAQLNQRAETLEDLPAGTVDLLLRAAQAGHLLHQLDRDVRFVTTDPTDRWVTWLDPGPRGTVRSVGATPLESGPLLRDLWQGRQLAPVATSATLAVGEDFGFMLGELGLTGRRPAAATVTVASPFAWQEQALCLAAEDLPAPDSPAFTTALVELLADLRREVRRQTLVLFTSYRLLQDTADGLRAAEADADLLDPGGAGELLVQSPRSGPGELRERFRRSRNAMLLGTSTFWEGVDFPGESLEIVVVTKLPFLVPTDPWVQARCEHLRAAGQDPFRDFMVRDAVLRLRQGVGRLIRRRRDRGVILLLDNRLATRGYGATFLAALPAPVRWLDGRHELAAATRDFLERS